MFRGLPGRREPRENASVKYANKMISMVLNRSATERFRYGLECIRIVCTQHK